MTIKSKSNAKFARSSKAKARPSRRKPVDNTIAAHEAITCRDGAVPPIDRGHSGFTGALAPQILTAEDVVLATRMAETLGLDIDAAAAKVRALRYGIPEPVTFTSTALEAGQLAAAATAAEAFGASANRAMGAGFSWSGNSTVSLSDSAKKDERLVPQHVFDIRGEVDALHDALDQLLFSLEPMLQMGPLAAELLRAPPPDPEPLPTPDTWRRAQVSHSLDSVEKGVRDAAGRLYRINAYLALPMASVPAMAPTSGGGNSVGRG